MMKQFLLLISLFLFTHFATAQVHFGIGGGGSAGVGDISPFSSAGYSAYVELSYDFNENMVAVLSGQVNGFVALPLDVSLAQAWYQIPVMAVGRYYILPKDGESMFKPYVQGGIGGVKSYYLKADPLNPGGDPQVIDDFWSFGYKVGVGVGLSIFNLQLNYLNAGKYQEYTLGSMDMTLGLLF
ncbi:hypothetical protein [Flammeovirga kamogawensis]|uniref:Outer membrane protein beta-barrel domain-containing protein n=1 Tax=Flammeovirga kamogawensis TaxID=373891 RepID=A0ABX8H1N5_9BACT|nr:hypothetical protein [Flammeovirga kamogawensis]MBB6459498.1 hypothetical protein [Flammeovirga kamogawensis]QWG09050.1 hypothetical protein KM029_08925 [Flammeovirga kamogawensis]TRX67338.1 hypothetical protein EO216_03965 [Flammeovirga kamogawensis]